MSNWCQVIYQMRELIFILQESSNMFGKIFFEKITISFKLVISFINSTILSTSIVHMYQWLIVWRQFYRRRVLWSFSRTMFRWTDLKCSSTDWKFSGEIHWRKYTDLTCLYYKHSLTNRVFWTHSLPCILFPRSD